MRKSVLLTLILISLTLGLGLYSCGDDGDQGPPGPQGPPGDAVRTFSESCSVCHQEDRIADVSEVHASESPTILLTISNVTVVAGAVTITFSITDDGVPLTGISSTSSPITTSDIRFGIAKLVPASAGNASFWQSYINTTQEVGNEDPTWPPAVGNVNPDGTIAIQATTERANAAGGVLIEVGAGVYTYTLSFNITSVTTPLAVTFDQTLTHRVASQVSDNITNGFFDFRPDLGVIATTRDIADVSSCNECHFRLGLHGGDRLIIEYCVVCHNPGSTDPHSGNTVDMKVMIHKIHMGENLPSVEDGGEYVIWGNRNSRHDYSGLLYPQDIRNCEKCHNEADASTPDAGNWKSVPTMEACGSCHDDVDFALGTGHLGGDQQDNNDCASCHPPTGAGIGQSVESAHVIPAAVASQSFQFNLVGIANTAPGEFPVVKFSVTDPLNAGAAYDIHTAPEFTEPTGVSRLAILIGWDTTDYTNTGSGSDPAGPISINPLSVGSGAIPATDNGDGTFTVTSPTAIPLGVTGSGVVALEGHPAADPDLDGIYDVRVPVKNVFLNFAITDAAPVARRTVVDIDKCKLCHEVLSLHGSNRTDEPQVCVICHNPNATDVERRPSDPTTTPDGKAEETIDFKRMIHAIHAGEEREEGIVIYGFSGTPNDFGEVVFPGRLNECPSCHDGDSFTVPLSDDVKATTVSTGALEDSPADDLNITPTSSACSACHDSDLAESHMEQNGGAFDALESEIE